MLGVKQIHSSAGRLQTSNDVVCRAMLHVLSLEVRKPNGDDVTLFISFVGVKGDWPWQSASFASS